MAQTTTTEAVPCMRPEPHPAHLHSGLRKGAVVHGKCPGVPADFFQPGRTYQRRRWQFQCLAVAPDPFDGDTCAVGFLYRPGEPATATALNPDDWANGNWTETTDET